MNASTRREWFAQTGAAWSVAAAPPVLFAQDPQPRRILSSHFPAEKLAASLLPRERWNPYPKASDRAAWEKLPAADRAPLVAIGEHALSAPWPPLPATLFLEFVREGNRSRYEAVSFGRRSRLRSLVIAECLEGKGRFLDQILNGIWAICEESFWGVPAHLNARAGGRGLPDTSEPIVDLFAAETASLLAWTVYLVGDSLDRVSKLVCERVHREVDQRILTPCMTTRFWWTGFGGERKVNNWNPWINSNWLAANLLLERDEKRRAAAVVRSVSSIDYFLDGYADDGGCDEGPSYWSRAGASLFDCLDTLHSATGGAVDAFDMPLVREIGRYIYRVHINEDYYVNFADAPAKVEIPADLVYRYGRRIGDEKMSALGAWAASTYRFPAEAGLTSIGRQLPALFDLEEIRKAPKSQSLVRDSWFPGIQVLTARVAEGSARGLYLGAKGGHNAESHNHNDVGNFVVYADGEPMLIDVGVETYSAKTFSSQRYDIWTMQSAWHNLPTIGGVMQHDGRQFEATAVNYHADDSAAEFRLDIAKAYPAEAGLASWVRTMRLDRAENRIRITEAYKLTKPVPEITLTLMTPCEVTTAPGELTLKRNSGKLRIAYDSRALEASVEERPLEDANLRGVWGARLFRIQMRAARPPLEARWQFEIVP